MTENDSQFSRSGEGMNGEFLRDLDGESLSERERERERQETERRERDKEEKGERETYPEGTNFWQV